MKLISDEEIKVKYLAYYTQRFKSKIEAGDFVENMNIGAGKFIAQAQLEACEKEHKLEMSMQEGYLEMAHKEKVREIFEEIGKYRTVTPFHNFPVYLPDEEWEALKEKWNE